MNFVSADVNDERAPKGLTCPTITAVPDDDLAVESCPLCNNPRTLGILQAKQHEGQDVATNSVGMYAVKPAVTSMNESTNAADGPAVWKEKSSEHNQIRRRTERPGTTRSDESAPILGARSKDQPSQIQSQTVGTKSVDKQTGLVGSRGCRGNDRTSNTDAGTSSSSMGFKRDSNDPHYLDP